MDAQPQLDQSRLMSLSLEIRLQIYEYTLAEEASLRWWALIYPDSIHCPRHYRAIPAIGMTCKQARANIKQDEDGINLKVGTYEVDDAVWLDVVADQAPPAVVAAIRNIHVERLGKEVTIPPSRVMSILVYDNQSLRCLSRLVSLRQLILDVGSAREGVGQPLPIWTETPDTLCDHRYRQVTRSITSALPPLQDGVSLMVCFTVGLVACRNTAKLIWMNAVSRSRFTEAERLGGTGSKRRRGIRSTRWPP